MTVEAQNRVLRAAHTRADSLETELIALLIPIIEQAGREAARRFKEKATDHLAAAAARRTRDRAALERSSDRSPLTLTAALDVQSNSTMVCVKPRPDEAAAIADRDGAPPETLHVTLAYLGEIDGDLRPILDILAAVAASHAPLAGVVGGYGQFGMPDGSSVGILLPDVPGLVELRVEVTEELQEAGVDYARGHGFEAHLTVDPDPEPGELEEMLPLSGSPLHFDDLLLVRGDTEVYPLPLIGVPPVTASLTAAGREPFCLPAELRTKTDPVRQAFTRNTMTESLRQAGLAWDVRNPFVEKMLAQAGSHITSISETTQLDVMRTIRAAHDEGLSIPDTAKAIQDAIVGSATARATMIARTELVGAANGGSLAAVQIVAAATGDTYSKTWRTAPGAKYPRHEDYPDLDGQTVPLDGDFEVGDSTMQFPGDPNGEAGEVINCRCTLTYGTGDTVTGSSGPRPARSPARVELDEIRLSLTAAGPAGWTAPAAEEILPINCGAAPVAAENAAGVARRLVQQATAREPATTAELTGIANRAGGKMDGLEFAVKSQSSLERKISSDLAEAHLTNPAATVEQVGGMINDSLRYTMEFSDADYASSVNQVVEALREKGYTQVKMKNFWGQPDYQGINAVYRSPDGQVFELQFHTPASFATKMENHVLYEKYRVTTDGRELVKLYNDMQSAQSNVQTPPGALTIGLATPGAVPELFDDPLLDILLG